MIKSESYSETGLEPSQKNRGSGSLKMTLSHLYLQANLNILDKLGFPKAESLKFFDLTDAALNSPTERVPLEPFVDCINAAANFTSDPNIALRLGYKFRVGAFGQTGNLYAYCKTLRQVIPMNDRYQKIAIDAGRVEYMKDASGGHFMCFRPYYADPVRFRPITDMIMASYVTTYRWLTWGSGEDILQTQLPYARPDDMIVHTEVFGPDIIFESEHSCLKFSDAAMLQPITTHDPERLMRAQVKLDKLLGLQMAGQVFEQAIEAALKQAIDAGQVSTHIVAQRMGMSDSALKTQLNASGEGMRSRLDRVRKALFIEKYEAGQSFSQIAMSLAYNDQAAMNRAFRRWYGMTPSQWRKQTTQRKT